MNHPFLLDPDRARAYRILCDHPSGSTRSWADQIGWTRAQVRGFLAALTKFGLAEVTPLGRLGSVFRPGETGLDRAPLGETGRDRATEPVYPRAPTDVLGSSGLTASRCALARVDVDNCAELAITAANDPFRGLSEWWPISLDHQGSHVMVEGWLGKGIPPEDIVRLVAMRARKWNIEKAGGPPRSLGAPWFKNGVPADWRMEKVEAARGQLSLVLLTQEKTAAVPTLEARQPSALESGPPPTPPQPSVPLSPETLTAWRTAFENAKPGQRSEVA